MRFGRINLAVEEDRRTLLGRGSASDPPLPTLSPQICNLTFYLKEPGAVYIFVPVYSDLTLWIIVRVRMSWGLTYLEWKRIYFKLFLSFQNQGDQILKSFSTLENSGLYFPLSPSHLRTKTKTFIIPKKIDLKK